MRLLLIKLSQIISTLFSFLEDLTHHFFVFFSDPVIFFAAASLWVIYIFFSRLNQENISNPEKNNPEDLMKKIFTKYVNLLYNFFASTKTPIPNVPGQEQKIQKEQKIQNEPENKIDTGEKPSFCSSSEKVILRNLILNSKLQEVIPDAYLFLVKSLDFLNKANSPTESEEYKEFIKENFHILRAPENSKENLEEIVLYFLETIYYNRQFHFRLFHKTREENTFTMDFERDIYYLLFFFAEKNPEFLHLMINKKNYINENEKEEIKKGVKNIVDFINKLSEEEEVHEIIGFYSWECDAKIHINILENFFLILLSNFKSPVIPANILKRYFCELFFLLKQKKKQKNTNTEIEIEIETEIETETETEIETIFNDVEEKVNSMLITAKIQEKLNYYPNIDEFQNDVSGKKKRRKKKIN